MVFTAVSVFYLCLFNTILLALTQTTIRRPELPANQPPRLQNLTRENPETSIFASGTGIPTQNLKSGVVVQIFSNATSYEDIRDAYYGWAEEHEVEFEFEVGLDVTWTQEVDAYGNVYIVFVIGENEQVIVRTEVEADQSGNNDLQTTSVEVEDEIESVVVIINNAQESDCTGAVSCPAADTAAVLGGRASNCQEVAKCQWINIIRIGVQKVCRTEILCS